MVSCHILSIFSLISSSLSESNKDAKKNQTKNKPQTKRELIHFLKDICYSGGAFNLLFASFHNNPWE